MVPSDPYWPPPVKQPVDWGKWFLIGAFAVMLIGLIGMIVSVERDTKRCEAAGGLYVKSSNGYDCIKVETISTAPQDGGK